MRRAIDWGDVILHAALVAFVMIIAQGSWAATAGLVIFFFVREVWQDRGKGHKFPDVWPIRRSGQKDAEFGVPAVMAIVLAVIL